MKSVGPILEIYSAPRPQPWRRVEKTNGSSRLDEEKHRTPEAGILNAPGKRSAATSRFETSPAAGLVGEATPPGFIAQVLGQVLATKKADPARCLKAYAEAERDPAEIIPLGWV